MLLLFFNKNHQKQVWTEETSLLLERCTKDMRLYETCVYYMKFIYFSTSMYKTVVSWQFYLIEIVLQRFLFKKLYNHVLAPDKDASLGFHWDNFTFFIDFFSKMGIFFVYRHKQLKIIFQLLLRNKFVHDMMVLGIWNMRGIS